MAVKINKTTTVDEIWVGGCRPMPAFVMEDGPFRPQMALWLDVTHGVVVGSKLLEPHEKPDALAEVFNDAVRSPLDNAGPPRCPTRIRIADVNLAENLRKKCDQDVVIEVAPTPELDRLMQDMAESLTDQNREDESYLEDGRLSAALMDRFFEAAAKLWKLAPWEHMYDAQLLELDCPRLKARHRAVSIIGNLGESFGALVFESIDGYMAMSDQNERLDEGLSIDLGTSLMAINFDRGADIPKTMRAEVAKHGWTVADANAYPSIQFRDPDMLCRPLCDDDVVLATVYTEALVAFFTKHIDTIRAGTFTSADENLKVSANQAAVAINITGPHPEMPWSVTATDVEESEHPAMGQSRAIVDEFLRHAMKAGRPDDWLDTAESICDSLYEFKLCYADGKISGWSAALVQTYLLDHLPHTVMVDDDTVERLPDVVDSFFSWAQSQGHVNARSGAAIAKCLQRNRPQFFRRIADERNFSESKALMKRLMSAGIDPTDRDAVEEYARKAQTSGL